MKLIPLTQGKFAMVDDVDFEWLNQWKWQAHFQNGQWYAEHSYQIGSGEFAKIEHIKMHRLIMNALKNELIDHRDRNGLNNQRGNLRRATRSQNAINSKNRISFSQYKGVSLYRNGKWIAQIGFNYRRLHLGYFVSEIEAAKAYDAKAKELFGEFAYLNFPEEVACAI